MIRLPQSEYLQNVGKLMTGSTLSQVIPILVAPVMARLYTPDDYGALGLYISITGLVAMLATLQYSNAIVVAKSERDAIQLVKLSLVILSITFLASMIGVFLGGNYLSSYFKSEELSKWIYFAPISIAFSGLNAVFTNYAIRRKEFGLVSLNRILGTVISTITSLTLGFLTQSAIGLFVGLWINQVINGISLAIRVFRKESDLAGQLRNADLSNVASDYKDFPKYSLPADFLNNLTNQLPVFMLNSYATLGIVGSYNMCNRILGLPTQFVSTAFGEVFRQKASEIHHKGGNSRSIFLKTFKVLLFTSIVPFGVIFIWGPELFVWVLGNKWYEAGKFAQILGLLFMFRYVISPLTSMYFIVGKLKEDFYLHILFFVFAFSSFYIAFEIGMETKIALLFFAISYSVVYSIYFIRSYIFTSENAKI